jgi:hypothetical protein
MKKLRTEQPGLQRQFLTVRQAGEITGLSPWTWRQWAYRGKVASVKAGEGKHARLLIPVGEITRVMSEGLRPAVRAHSGRDESLHGEERLW